MKDIVLFLFVCLFVVGFGAVSCNRNIAEKPDMEKDDTRMFSVGDRLRNGYYDTGVTTPDVRKYTSSESHSETTIWTDMSLQATFILVQVGGEIGLDVYPNLDQFIRFKHGQGKVMMGDDEVTLSFIQPVSGECSVFIPAGKWHNIVNTGNTPLKLFSIYAPPEHPVDIIHDIHKEIAEAGYPY